MTTGMKSACHLKLHFYKIIRLPMLFNSAKNFAVIAIILLWALALGASFGRSDLFNFDNSLSNAEQVVALGHPKHTMLDLDVKSVISVPAEPSDTQIQPAHRVSETATLWLVFLGLGLVVIGGFRRHK
jgi:hypothetical protein